MKYAEESGKKEMIEGRNRNTPRKEDFPLMLPKAS